MNETNPIEVTGSVAPETPDRRADTEATVSVPAPGESAEIVETTTPPSTLDNILTLSLVGVLVITVIVMIIRKAISNKKPAAPVAAEPAEASVADAPTAPGTAGEVKLNNVDPKTAAMLMAIVADKMQKPINELRFISIKEVE